MALEESTGENDAVFTVSSLKFVVDKSLLPYVKEAVVDYETTWWGESTFTISSPRASSC
ncbi:hypothetical protein [Ammonifex degensii]|uniref:hypothetical protein n=1 Tax=Ammonifex degensii TaxID=42838 RepID=UPI0003146AF0|nr:hypothetical protein [Ammonifex degensii]